MSDLRLEWGAEQRRRVEEEAAATLPEECCGILLGRRDGDRAVVHRVLPVDNARRRDREHGYEVDPRDLIAARRRGRRQGLDIVGFFHSHPDGTPRPSRTDAGAAWPEASYVIVARAGAAWTVTCWRRGADGRMVAEGLVERRGRRSVA
jgi:proteasome lid subunit RPN8/RPN11